MKMFWPERVGGKLVIRERKVEDCEYDFSSEFSAFHTSILRLAGAGRHGVFAMIDPKDDIKKLVVFFHETKVSCEEPPGHKFTSRGIIVADHTFGTSDEADAYFDLFKSELPSRPRIDAAIGIECIVKEMHPYKNTMTNEEHLTEAKRIRDLFHAMQRGKQL